MNRRQLLRSVTAGLAGILASRRPPAHAQTTRLHLLFRVDFIPQGEAELKRQLADYGKQMKMDNENAYHINCFECHDAAIKAKPELAQKISGSDPKGCAKCHVAK